MILQKKLMGNINKLSVNGKENIMSKTISVALANRFNIKLEESLLDSYSLKKYNTLYEESKTNVNKDIT